MRVVLSTIGKFHTFDLARQLHKREALEAIFTGYPRFKLRNEEIPQDRIKSFSWLQTAYMAKGRFSIKSPWIDRELAWYANQTLDAFVKAGLPACDIYMGLSGSALSAGKQAKARGAVYICDRGSSHIRFQNRILTEEYKRYGLHFRGVDPRVIDKEEAEYASADAITVPSTFAMRTFIEMGVAREKLHRIPYGVDLSHFQPTDTPDPDYFDVLFAGSVSVRKGIRYLLESFAGLKHPRKRLTIVGSVAPEVEPIIAQFAATLPIQCTGARPQSELKQIMSKSHVMVLPSVEEGLALVQGQALACGCPVIATTNTGAEDLFHDGVEGFIVPIRDPESITGHLQRLADNPDERQRMSQAALKRVKDLGGWNAYGQKMYDLYAELIEQKV